MPVHESFVKISNVFEEVRDNLFEAGLKWHTETHINNAIQDAYDFLVSELCPIEYAKLIPKNSSPYYDLSRLLPDLMYVTGIYNPTTRLWLFYKSPRKFKGLYQTYMALGEPRFYNIVDFRRVIIWPYLSTATGPLLVTYKAKAPTISNDHVPILPQSVANQLLQYFATAELLEQAFEFSKAVTWFDKLFNPTKPNEPSIMDQARKEIADLAGFDRLNVLEPYRWLFYGGSGDLTNYVENETPVGDIDGVNNVFTLAAVPNPVDSLMFMRNGQLYFRDVAFTINGSTITINTGYIPVDGDYLRAWYRTS